MAGMILNYSFLFGAMLLAGALSGYVSERSGIVNIGIDGMMCFGAVFFGIYSSSLIGMPSVGPGMIIFAFLLTMITTMIMGVMHAYVCINLKGNHIISGTAINLIGVALATFLNPRLGSLMFDGATRLKSGFNDFLFMGNSFYGSSLIIFVIVILLAIGIFIFAQYTKTGLRYRAIGENPNAVDAQGINVYKYQWIAVILSSALAGLAGAIFLFSVKEFGGNTQGYGFLALAIMIAGGWRVPWIGVVSFVFAMLTAWSQTNVLTNAGTPKDISFALPYIITIAVLIIFCKNVRPPQHNGIPFDKYKR